MYIAGKWPSYVVRLACGSDELLQEGMVSLLSEEQWVAQRVVKVGNVHRVFFTNVHQESLCGEEGEKWL